MQLELSFGAKVPALQGEHDLDAGSAAYPALQEMHWLPEAPRENPPDCPHGLHFDVESATVLTWPVEHFSHTTLDEAVPAVLTPYPFWQIVQERHFPSLNLLLLTAL